MVTPSTPLFLLLLLFFQHHTSTTIATTAAPAVSPFPSNTSLDFILSSCNATLYPTLCYTTLSPYASNHHLDSARLASLSISVSLSIARSASSFLSSLPSPASPALHDCFSTFSEALSLIQDSRKQMTQIIESDRYDQEAWRFSVSNVMTWMSAAMTNEDTCVDGFDDVGDGGEGEAEEDEVRGRVRVARESASVALALVNAYAARMGF
ncbi:hypothetical protein Droror1_Dr00022776 [Drosera rotundifolia]